MNYSFLIDSMVWSYSRLTTFEDCKYKFFLKYIMGMGGIRLFYAEYGTLLHTIIEKYLNGEFTKEAAVEFYLQNYHRVFNNPPPKIADSYFKQGLEYVENITPPCEGSVEAEKRYNFKVNNHEFCGIVDILAKQPDGYIICDNKSRTLKHGKSGKTKADDEIEKYLRQLYLYSVATNQELGSDPKSLMFNCFRGNYIIEELFKKDKQEKTCLWAETLIQQIRDNECWSPNLEWFKCKYICDQRENCEYISLL